MSSIEGEQRSENQQDALTNSLKGELLLAMPGLMDPNFHGTISLICEHNSDGAIGLVINQPLPLDLASILEQIGLEVSQANIGKPVLAGGPVSVERGFVMHKPDSTKWQSSMAVNDQISITTSEDIIQAMARDEAPDGSILILGYAGWGNGQLEDEILENSWLTLPSSNDILFDVKFDERVRVATQNAGIDYSRMATGAGGHA